MNEEPKGTKKPAWSGFRGALCRLLLITLVLLPLSWMCYAFLVKSWKPMDGTEESVRHFTEWIVTLVAVISVTFLASLLTIPRWIFCWRSFCKFIFVIACLITLIALFYAEEDWRGKHDWEKFKREEEAKGEKFDFADFVPPPVPDDQNFALTPIVASSYEAVLDNSGHEVIPRNTNVVNRLQMPVLRDYSDWPTNGGGSWAKATLTDLKPWQDYYRTLAATTNLFPVAPQAQTPAQDVLLALSKYDPTIEELREASQLPYSRFPIEYDKDDPAAILLPHLAALKQCSQVLQLRAIAELQNNESQKALDDIKLSLRLTDSIHTEPFIISQLVRFAIFQITLPPIYEGLAEHQWSDAQLAELDSELAKLDFLADYEFSIRSEPAAHIKLIDYLEQKRSRYQEFSSMFDDNDQHDLMNNFPTTAIFYLAPKGWFYQNEVVLAQMHQKWNVPMVDDAHQMVSPKMVLEGNAVELNMRPSPFNFFARLMLPALGSFAQKTAYSQNAVNLARVALALERYRLAHGEFPESLDMLAPQFIEKIPHDIINGQPLKYRRTDDGQFVLYSVGWNETDDGGAVVIDKKYGTVHNNEGDWVWRYPSR
jgi:hypothetical protein